MASLNWISNHDTQMPECYAQFGTLVIFRGGPGERGCRLWSHSGWFTGCHTAARPVSPILIGVVRVGAICRGTNERLHRLVSSQLPPALISSCGPSAEMPQSR